MSIISPSSPFTSPESKPGNTETLKLKIEKRNSAFKEICRKAFSCDGWDDTASAIAANIPLSISPFITAGLMGIAAPLVYMGASATKNEFYETRDEFKDISLKFKNARAKEKPLTEDNQRELDLVQRDHKEALQLHRAAPYGALAMGGMFGGVLASGVGHLTMGVSKLLPATATNMIARFAGQTASHASNYLFSGSQMLMVAYGALKLHAGLSKDILLRSDINKLKKLHDQNATDEEKNNTQVAINHLKNRKKLNMVSQSLYGSLTTAGEGLMVLAPLLSNPLLAAIGVSTMVSGAVGRAISEHYTKRLEGAPQEEHHSHGQSDNNKSILHGMSDAVISIFSTRERLIKDNTLEGSIDNDNHEVSKPSSIIQEKYGNLSLSELNKNRETLKNNLKNLRKKTKERLVSLILSDFIPQENIESQSVGEIIKKSDGTNIKNALILFSSKDKEEISKADNSLVRNTFERLTDRRNDLLKFAQEKLHRDLRCINSIVHEKTQSLLESVS